MVRFPELSVIVITCGEGGDRGTETSSLPRLALVYTLQAVLGA